MVNLDRLSGSHDFAVRWPATVVGNSTHVQLNTLNADSGKLKPFETTIKNDANTKQDA